MRFGVLGPLIVWTDAERIVPVPGAKVRLLLAALLVRQGEPVSTDRLIEELWNGKKPGKPAAALAVKASQLRRVLHDAEPGARALLTSGPAGLALRTRAVDAVDFDALVARAADETRPEARASLLDEALKIWRGPAYADHRDEPFAAAAVARVEEQRLTAIEDRAEAHLAMGRHALVADALVEQVARHPLRERIRALHMLALYRAGRPTEALDSYTDLRARLVDDLGVEPGAHLATLHRKILAHDPSLDPPPYRPTARPSTNLPAAVGELVGRDPAVAEGVDLVGRHRLVSLTGTGGVGKTRLAVEIARRIRPAYPDGAWLADLAAVDGGRDAVADVVVSALGLRDAAAGSGEPTDRLAANLSSRKLLLVLDNCEHLIEDAAHLASKLLAAAPDLRVVATSREPLGLPGELVWPVPPLDVPGEDDEPGTASAVRLFVSRAAAAHRGFALGPSNAEMIATVCRRLDGIPLALELAATRVRGLGLEGLVAGLDDRFRVLGGGNRAAPARQQTLTATIDWSWQLLTAPERIVLRRLAVNADGCTLEAAEAVCVADDVVAREVADVLARLVDRSLVVRTERVGEPPRFRLLESVAAFCLDRLREADDLEPTRARHLRYFVAFAANAGPHLRDPDQGRWLRRLDGEAPNLRVALDTAIRTNAGELAVELVDAQAWYWFLRGRLGEARRALRAALAAAPATPTPVRGRATAWETGFGFLLGDVTDWPARHDAALRAFDQTGDEAGRARAAWWLAYCEIDLGDVAATGAVLAEVASAFDEAGDVWGRAATLTLTAKLAYIRGDAHAVARDSGRAAELFGRLGDNWGVLQATEWSAAHAGLTGDQDRAARLHADGLEMARDLRLWADVSGRLGWLAWTAMERGDYPTAMTYGREALALAEEQSAPLLVVFARMGLAWTARRSGDLDAATEYLEQFLRDAKAQEAEAGQPLYVAGVLVELGHVSELRGDPAAAAAHHREALSVARSLGAARDVALAFEGLASAAAAAGDHRRAAQLLGAAAGARESSATPPSGAEQPDIDRAVSRARGALGAGFDAAFREGLRLARVDRHLLDGPLEA